MSTKMSTKIWVKTVQKVERKEDRSRRGRERLFQMVEYGMLVIEDSDGADIR